MFQALCGMGGAILAIIGIERSLRHMAYAVSDEFRALPNHQMLRFFSAAGCVYSLASILSLQIWLGVKTYRGDSNTYASFLQGCIKGKVLPHGRLVTHMILTGVNRDISLETKLVTMYAKCGSLMDAHRALAKMPERNVVSWTTMITAYSENGHGEEALALFYHMQRTCIQPNQFTFASALPACANLVDLEHGKEVHGTRKLYREMQLKGMKPNSDTFASVLPAYANLADLHAGKEVHGDIIKSGCVSDVFVGSALVDMYAKCGSLEDAQKVFEKMPRQDVVSWTTMIGGYAQKGHVDEALDFFQKMPERNLPSMRARSIEDARKMFDNMLTRDVVSWTAMIVGYAIHGYGKEAIQLFEQMQHSGTKPDHITFVGILSACCHAGLVDDGWQYFECMRQNYHITPAVEHYCCMIDLLGRAGCLDEALDFVNKMPMKPDAVVWRSLLGVCRNHTNIKLGQHVEECLFEADPKNVAHYVLLSNIYAAAGRCDDAEMVRKMMRDRRIKKLPGCSWIEVNYKVHAFFVGDRSHPETHKIYAMLKRLSGKMKEAGYASNTDFVLHDVEEEQKDHILCQHSKKMAIAFGLLQTCPGTTIRIVKNLQVCGDCHTATKFTSKIAAREIAVRDVNHFHHFKDGNCSCGDYW
eukprot:Gb_01322 [translate_table: standard]